MNLTWILQSHQSEKGESHGFLRGVKNGLLLTSVFGITLHILMPHLPSEVIAPLVTLVLSYFVGALLGRNRMHTGTEKLSGVFVANLIWLIVVGTISLAA